MTDWTSYYERPAPTASVTRKISQKRLIELFSQRKDWVSICEIGGGNSCFVDGVLQSLNVTKYHVIDNNPLGSRKLQERYEGRSIVTTENADVLNLSAQTEKYDIVYSVGLIEDFDPTNTAKAIDAHFSLVKPGGLVACIFTRPRRGFIALPAVSPSSRTGGAFQMSAHSRPRRLRELSPAGEK